MNKDREKLGGQADWRRLGRYFAAGASARVTAAVLMSPIDTIKTRLQFQGRFKSVRQYEGARHALVTILKEEGVLGFFKGLPPRLMYITPAAAISFMFYEQFKALLKMYTTGDRTNHNNFIFKHPAVPLIAGGLARLLGTACRTPFDILRQRLQVQGSLLRSQYKGLGTFAALRLLIKTEGWRGLWAGYTIAAMRDVPFAMVYFLTYELSKQAQVLYMKDGEHAYNHLLAGALAGGCAATCTIPFDVVKTRLQTLATLPPEERERYKGILSTFRVILQEEGPRGLTRGLGPRLMYLMPAASLTFTAYEQYKKLLGVQ